MKRTSEAKIRAMHRARAKGKTYSQIAKALDCSPITVARMLEPKPKRKKTAHRVVVAKWEAVKPQRGRDRVIRQACKLLLDALRMQ